MPGNVYRKGDKSMKSPPACLATPLPLGAVISATQHPGLLWMVDK